MQLTLVSSSKGVYHLYQIETLNKDQLKFRVPRNVKYFQIEKLNFINSMNEVPASISTLVKKKKIY